MENFAEELEKYLDQDIENFLELGKPIDRKYIRSNTKHHYNNTNQGKKNKGSSERVRSDSTNLMSKYEAEYALKLLNMGLTLYREPHLKDCTHIADFYVYHEDLEEGVLVEITSSSRISGDKKKQHESLREFSELYGIPFIPLYKEDLENMGINTSHPKPNNV